MNQTVREANTLMATIGILLCTVRTDRRTKYSMDGDESYEANPKIFLLWHFDQTVAVLRSLFAIILYRCATRTLG